MQKILKIIIREKFAVFYFAARLTALSVYMTLPISFFNMINDIKCDVYLLQNKKKTNTRKSTKQEKKIENKKVYLTVSYNVYEL